MLVYIAVTCTVALGFAPHLLRKPVRPWGFLVTAFHIVWGLGLLVGQYPPFTFLFPQHSSLLSGTKHVLVCCSSQLRGEKQSSPEEPQNRAEKCSSLWRYLLRLFCCKTNCSDWCSMWTLRYLPLLIYRLENVGKFNFNTFSLNFYGSKLLLNNKSKLNRW